MTLYVMDTDLLSLYQRDHPQLSNRISLARKNGIIIKTTAITVEEQYAGRLAQIRKAKTSEVLVNAYDRLITTVSFFVELEILPYNLLADSHFRQLRQMGIRIGTQDLRIASITLAYNGIVITRNRKDFDQVPGLTIEDWSL
jgi:tRNA(fMet)-specific endonuclease VapC